MLGIEGSNYHFEFTHCRTHPVTAAPTPEDLVVLYLPAAAEWQATCASMLAAGFEQVSSRDDLAGIARCSGGQWPQAR